MSVTVSIEDLDVRIDGNHILDHVSLTVAAGSFVTLLGPSGSGKTTTLNVLAGFIRKTGGQVRFDDRVIDDLPPHERNIGFLFQNYALFPHMTVGQNIEFPLQARRIPANKRRALVSDALELVRLPHLTDRSVRSLSGGQQQRVALARALVFEPSLLLLDEPLAALDKQLRETMQVELKRIQTESGTTTLAVTHDQVEAMSLADVVAIMDQGQIVQLGSPEEVYRRPATLFVARFLGEANLIPVADDKAVAIGTPIDSAGGKVIAVARPEDLDLVDKDAPGPRTEGTVEHVVYQGTRYRVTVRCAGLDAPLVVSFPPHEHLDRVSAGDTVHVAVREGILHTVPDTAESTSADANVAAVAAS